tara:strand:+ start:2957 stop:4087 length:1131 start_codon:yes stop_codon:yes gene_type:complete
MSFILPYKTEIYETEGMIEVYEYTKALLDELLRKTVILDTFLTNLNTNNNIKNYKIKVKNKLIRMKVLQDQINNTPTINDLKQMNINEATEFEQNTAKMRAEIETIDKEVEQIRDTILIEQSKIDENLKAEVTNINAEINTANNIQNRLNQEQNYKKYIHNKRVVEKKDIYRMDLANDDTYNKISYNIMNNNIQDSTSQQKQNLQNKINKIARQTDDIKDGFKRTDKLKRADKVSKALDDLQQNLNKNNQPASNNIESFSNIDEYDIQYLSPDYKEIMLNEASCKELDTTFNEKMECNDSNYNKDDDNIKNCMQRAWCEYQGLSNTLQNNQSTSSQDKERYQDANQYYNLAVVDSINLSIGIFGVVFLILKNRNII